MRGEITKVDRDEKDPKITVRLLGPKRTFKEAQEALSKAGIKPQILEQMQLENGKFVMDVIDEN